MDPTYFTPHPTVYTVLTIVCVIIMITEVFMKHKILSTKSILNAYTHTHTHTQAPAKHEHGDYTKLKLHTT